MMAPGMGPGPFHDKTQAAVMITILRTMMTIAFFFFPLLPRLQPPQAGPLQISQQRFTASVTWNKWN